MCERKCYFIKDTRIISNNKNIEMIVSTEELWTNVIWINIFVEYLWRVDYRGQNKHESWYTWLSLIY